LWDQKKEADVDEELKKDERFSKAFAFEWGQKQFLDEIELRKQEVQFQSKRYEKRIMTMDHTAMPDEQNVVKLGNFQIKNRI
jgi:hypothetical protein